jgi:hypothetical protein
MVILSLIIFVMPALSFVSLVILVLVLIAKLMLLRLDQFVSVIRVIISKNQLVFSARLVVRNAKVPYFVLFAKMDYL